MKTTDWFENLNEQLKGSVAYKLEALLFSITEGICEKMEELKINKTELAKRMDVSLPSVTRMMKGESNFTLKKLIQIGNALGKEFKAGYVDANEIVETGLICPAAPMAAKTSPDNTSSTITLAYVDFDFLKPKKTV